MCPQRLISTKSSAPASVPHPLPFQRSPCTSRFHEPAAKSAPTELDSSSDGKRREFARCRGFDLLNDRPSAAGVALDLIAAGCR